MRYFFAIILLILTISIQPAFAESDDFSITITVNYLEFDLQYIAGGNYLAWWASSVSLGDTTSTDYDQIVKLVNRSNIPIDVYFEVSDNPDSTSPDTLWDSWSPSIIPGVNAFVLRWAPYSSPPVAPEFADSRIVSSTPTLIDENVFAGTNRYLYGWFVAPTEGVMGERHRLLGRFTIAPSAGLSPDF